MTELEFKALANQGFNRIPLIIEAIADLDTPLSLYLKLTQHNHGGKNSFLLESVVGGERFRPLFFHWPSCVDCIAFTWDENRNCQKRHRYGNKRRQSARFHRTIPVKIQSGHHSRTAAVLRRIGRIFRI